MKSATISLGIKLDNDNRPEHIDWHSTDGQNQSKQPAKAFLLSIFEKDTLETLKIDLWTKDLEVGEMNRLMYNTLRGLAETYHKATNDENLSNDFARFAQYFGEEAHVITRSPEQN